MKTKLMSSFLTIVCLITFSSFLKAQDAPKDAEAAQKAWVAYMTPGEEQKMLAETVGDWKMVIKAYMDPSAQPQVFEGTAVVEMVLGGRYLKSVQKADMMGMPFEGLMYLAFDNVTKEYISTWIDNTGTGIMIGKGDFDKNTYTLVQTGKLVDPTVGKEVDFKEKFRFISAEKMTLEMFSVKGDKEIKNMEIEYTRK